MKEKFTQILACLLMLAWIGCGESPDQTPSADPEVQQLPDDARADSLATQIKAPGMTLWIAPIAQPEWQKRGLRWRVEGRVSKNLKAVTSFVAGRHYTDSAVTSARKFSVLLTREELGRVIEGDYLYIELEPSVGATPLYSAAITFKARFHNISGSERLILEPWIEPILTTQGVKMRAQASTEPGFELESVFTDDDFDPDVSFWPDWAWTMDWGPEELLLASDILDDPVYFTLFDGADNRYRASANIEIRATEAGLAVGHPESAFPPPTCSDEVETCLNQLRAAAPDTSECGTAPQVQACLNPQSF